MSETIMFEDQNISPRTPPGPSPLLSRSSSTESAHDTESVWYAIGGDGGRRRLKGTCNSFSALNARLMTLFNYARLRVEYDDDEDQRVIIANDEELLEANSLASSAKRRLEVIVTKLELSDPSSSSSTPAFEAHGHARQQVHVAETVLPYSKLTASYTGRPRHMKNAWDLPVKMDLSRETRAPELHNRPTNDIPTSSKPTHDWFRNVFLESARHVLRVPVFSNRHHSQYHKTLNAWNVHREASEANYSRSVSELSVSFSQPELLDIALNAVEMSWLRVDSKDVLSRFNDGEAAVTMASFMSSSPTPKVFVRSFKDLIGVAKLAAEDKMPPPPVTPYLNRNCHDNGKPFTLYEILQQLKEATAIAIASESDAPILPLPLAANQLPSQQSSQQLKPSNNINLKQNSQKRQKAAIQKSDIATNLSSSSSSVSLTASNSIATSERSASPAVSNPPSATEVVQPRMVFLRIGHQFVVMARKDRYTQGGHGTHVKVQQQSTKSSNVDLKQTSLAQSLTTSFSSTSSTPIPALPIVDTPAQLPSSSSHILPSVTLRKSREIKVGRADESERYRLEGVDYWSIAADDPAKGPTYPQLGAALFRFTTSDPFVAVIKQDGHSATRGLLTNKMWKVASHDDKVTAILLALTRSILNGNDQKWLVARKLLHPVHKHGSSDGRGGSLTYDDSLSVVLTTFFVSETARNPVSWLTTLMLLDLMEARLRTGIDWLQLQQSEAEQATPINFQAAWPTLDFFTLLHRGGEDDVSEGIHPMAHKSSYDQLRKEEARQMRETAPDSVFSIRKAVHGCLPSPREEVTSSTTGKEKQEQKQKRQKFKLQKAKQLSPDHYLSCRARELGIITAWVKFQIYDPCSVTRCVSKNQYHLFAQVAHMQSASHAYGSSQHLWSKHINEMIMHRLADAKSMAYVSDV